MAASITMSPTDCAASFGLTSKNPGTFNDVETALTAAQAAATTVYDIAEIGYSLLLAETPALPVLAIIGLGYSIYELVNIFGGGKPKFEDTNNVIWAYNMSAYWPLHALATDLKIAEKNGAPISDSNPAVQAQFSAWKQGTIVSIQQLAGWPGGSGSPGYWQLQRLINGSWAASGGGQQSVLNYVRAIDRFTQILACLFQQQKAIKPPPPPPAPPPTQGGDGDELANQTQSVIAVLDKILAALGGIPQTAGGDGNAECCTKVVAGITQVTVELQSIVTAINTATGNAGSINLTPIVNELAGILKAIAQIQPCPTVDLTALVDAVNMVAATIARAAPTDVSGIVDQLKQSNSMMDVPQAIIDRVAEIGLVTPSDAQLAGGGPWAYINTLLHDEWAKLNHKPSPEELKAAGDDPVFGPFVKAKLSGAPMVPFKEVLKMSPSVLGDIAGLAIEKVMELAYPVGKTLYGPMIQDMLKVHEGLVSQFVKVQPGGEITNATKLLTEALTFGVGAHWAALIGEKIVPGKHMGVTAVAALLAELAGFKEISQGLIDSEVEAAVARPHKYFMNLTTRSQLPSSGQAAELFSRRKITTAQLTALMAYAGFSDEWGASLASIAYRPMSPMMLAAGFANADVDMAKLQDTLEYMGIRPEDLPLAEQAVITRSLQQTRQALVNEAVTAYGQGVVGDAELDQILTDAGYGKSAAQLVKQRALIARRITLARESEAYLVPEITQGLVTADEGLQALEAAGVQPWQAELKVALAEARAAITQARKALAAERKLELDRQRNLTRAAVAEYERGALDEAGLTAALVASGLDAILVATIVAVENAKRAGRLKLVFGQLLTPAAATLLTDQVSALETQFKKQLIDETSLRAQLTALNVDGPEIEALVARWAAARAAATKTGYVLPV